MVPRLLKKPEVFDRHRFHNSTLYQQIRDGLFTPPVRMGANSSAWPEHESDAILRARIAGRSDAEIRELVSRLVADRSKLAERAAA
jgi:prophage regulatory protein